MENKCETSEGFKTGLMALSVTSSTTLGNQSSVALGRTE